MTGYHQEYELKDKECQCRYCCLSREWDSLSDFKKNEWLESHGFHIRYPITFEMAESIVKTYVPFHLPLI